MRRGLAIAAVLGLVIAGALWWTRRAPSTSSVIARDAGEVRVTPPPTQHRVPPDARGAPVTPPADAAPRTPEQSAELASGLGDAHAHLQDAVAPCFADSPVSDRAVIKFRYVLIVSGGAAHATDVLVTEATEPIVDVVPCITAAIENASWQSQLADVETPVDDQLVVAELR